MMLNLEDKSLILRLLTENDKAFLEKVYFNIREAEMQLWLDATVEMKTTFLTQQFNAQHEYYQKNYVGAYFWVIEKSSIDMGRLYYDEAFRGGIRIIDIALLPDFQNKGIGTTLLKSILERAKALEKNVTIHVESFNPAMDLYKKLGFQKNSETNGVYHLLEWNYKH